MDEAYLDVSDRMEGSSDGDEAIERAAPVAKDIKRRVKEERGLTATIGISSNKFLAKLGSDFQKPDGLTVILDHGGGDYTIYGSLVRADVKEGQNITRGQVIGYEGSTGYSTGPHLHFEIRYNDNYINPCLYLGC